MTLIIAMRAGPGTGVACADRYITYTEPSESSERKLEYKARKIIHLGGSYFVGFAGSLGFAEKLIYGTKHQLTSSDPEFEHTSYQDVVSTLTRHYDALRELVVADYVGKSLGISWEDYKSGTLVKGHEERVVNILSAERENPKLFDVDLIICGIENDGIGEQRDFAITTYKPPVGIDFHKYTDAVGITDMADIATSEFLEDVSPRESHIGLARCAYAIMEAKKKAERRNPGVGYRGQLVWIDESGNFHETSERETNFLSALIGFNHNMPDLVTEDLVYKVFEDIVERPKTKVERSIATDHAFSTVKDVIQKDVLYRYMFFDDH